MLRLFFTFALLSTGTVLLSSFLRQQLPEPEDIRPRLLEFKFPERPRFTVHETTKAELGYELFRDTRLSINGELACVSCHKPEHSFADDRPFSEGLDRSDRNTPAVINLFAAQWFFWDGRADSLVMQASEPLESPHEHGISRWHVAEQLFHNYRPLYEAIFGPFPEVIVSLFEEGGDQNVPALPPAIELNPPEGLSPYWSEYHFGKEDPPPSWVKAYQSMSQSQRNGLDEVFINASRALAQYQLGLLAGDSPFDRFLHRLASKRPRQALSSDFTAQDLRGLMLFIGKAACDGCHSGPLFTDGQFHNTGLARSGRLSMGRAEGLVRWAAHPLACDERFESRAEDCKEARFRERAIKAAADPRRLGQHKTPSLRNVAKTAPYLHDGSFRTLEELVAAYNEPFSQQGLGQPDSRMKTLKLSPSEMADLVSFLRTLSSEIEDLSSY